LENTIFCGDCKDVLERIPSESIDLIYLDPPFFSNRQYEVIWKDGCEVRAFEDRWKGGIEHYISWMRERIEQCYRVLKETGSIYLHCDWHASHYLKVMMDKIFGYNNFRNEIVWCYKGGNSKKTFRKKHDTILFYTKTNEYFFDIDAVRIPYDNRILRYCTKDENGKIYYKTGQKGSRGKVYLHPKGQLLYDWWTDIPSATMVHGKEYQGYPTQKPEALLERIIKASSKEGDIVLDPFCGCGTAVAVAQKLGRKWIGIDVSPTACRLIVKRLQALGVKITTNDIIGLPRTVEELKSIEPFEFQNWVCRKLGFVCSRTKSGDMGIDGKSIDGRVLQVKQSERVGRNVVDYFETAMRRAGKTRGVIVAFSFTRSAYEEVARAMNEEGLEIELKKVEDLL